VFNLSADAVQIRAIGQISTGPSQAAQLAGDSLTLGPNGFCFLTPLGGTISVTA
jgi:hypothetical protein